MRQYSTAHLVPLGIFVVGLVLVTWLGRRHHGTPGPAAFSRGGAAALAAVVIPFQILDLVLRFSLTTLPLHLCDLAWIAAAVALWTHRPYWVGLTCYWGIVLTTQAIITPSVEDFPSVWYFAYWAHHIMTVWAAFYLAVGLGLAPRWRDYRTTIETTAAWAVFVYVFNTFAGSNYGYLMRKPRSSSILNLFGPWPWYVAVLVVVVAGAFALLTVALQRLSRVGQPRSEPGSRRTPVRS